jgi:hypothetical protein
MFNDESGKAEGYLSLHDVCSPVNGELGLDSSLWGDFFGYLVGEPLSGLNH